MRSFCKFFLLYCLSVRLAQYSWEEKLIQCFVPLLVRKIVFGRVIYDYVSLPVAVHLLHGRARCACGSGVSVTLHYAFLIWYCCNLKERQ